MVFNHFIILIFFYKWQIPKNGIKTKITLQIWNLIPNLQGYLAIAGENLFIFYMLLVERIRFCVILNDSALKKVKAANCCLYSTRQSLL
jgi:hypothetical protein